MPTTSHSSRTLVMLAVFIATFMASVEVTIVTTALPTIISALDGLAFQSWIMTAYLLTMAISTPICGNLADCLGRKKIFQWGVIFFTVGSLLSGLSPNIFLLIAARAVQGIGAGAMLPLTFTIIADLYSFRERAKVMALNNTAWGISALIGPLLGGFLVDHLSWHWVFFVNVPLGVVVFLLVAFSYRTLQGTAGAEQVARPSLDWMGILWLALALVALLLGVQALSTQLALGLVLIVVALFCAALLVRQEKRSPNPLINPQMFRNRTFTVQIITITLLCATLIAYETYFPIWLQSIYGLAATIAGLVLSVSSVMWVATSFLVPRLITRFPPRSIAMGVVLVEICFYASLTLAGPGYPVWMFYVIAAFNGAGMGIVVSMNTLVGQRLVSEDMVGTATGVITLGRTLGQTLMTGVLGAVLNLTLQARRGSVSMRQLNEAMSSHSELSAADQVLANGVILQGLRAIFGVVLIIFVMVLIANWRDPKREVVQ